MKKILLATLFGVFIAGTMHAQDDDMKIKDKKYRIGLFVAPTFNSLKPTANVADNYEVTALKGKTGFGFGLTGEVLFSSKYSIFTGLGLDWRGGSINVAHDNSTLADSNFLLNSEVHYRTQYLTIPIGVKMTAYEISDVKIFAQAGFDLSLLLSQRGDFTLSGPNVTKTSGENEKLGDYAKVTPLNFAWHIGPGAEYTLGNGSAVYLGLIYRNSFVDATTPKLNAKGNRFSDGNIRANSFEIRFGYFF